MQLLQAVPFHPTHFTPFHSCLALAFCHRYNSMVCFIFSCDLLAPIQHTRTFRLRYLNNCNKEKHLSFFDLNWLLSLWFEKNKIKKCSKIRWLTQAHAGKKTKRLRHNERHIIFYFLMVFAFHPSGLIPFPFGFLATPPTQGLSFFFCFFSLSKNFMVLCEA